GPQDDEVFDVGAVELDPAVHEIIERGSAFGYAKPDRPRRACLLARVDVGRQQAAAGPIVPPRGARSLRGIALRVQLFNGAVTIVRTAVGYELLRHRAIPIEALRLKVRTIRTVDERPFIPVEAEPPQAV